MTASSGRQSRAVLICSSPPIQIGRGSTRSKATTRACSDSAWQPTHSKVIKAIKIVITGQDLAAEGLCSSWQIGMVDGFTVIPGLDEGLRLAQILDRQHRTGRIDKDTARCQQRPQGIEEAALGFDQALDVRRLAQPANVGMAPDDAGRRAGGIDQ